MTGLGKINLVKVSICWQSYNNQFSYSLFLNGLTCYVLVYLLKLSNFQSHLILQDLVGDTLKFISCYRKGSILEGYSFFKGFHQFFLFPFFRSIKFQKRVTDNPLSISLALNPTSLYKCLTQ